MPNWIFRVALIFRDYRFEIFSKIQFFEISEFLKFPMITKGTQKFGKFSDKIYLVHVSNGFLKDPSSNKRKFNEWVAIMNYIVRSVTSCLIHVLLCKRKYVYYILFYVRNDFMIKIQMTRVPSVPNVQNVQSVAYKLVPCEIHLDMNFIIATHSLIWMLRNHYVIVHGLPLTYRGSPSNFYTGGYKLDCYLWFF